MYLISSGVTISKVLSWVDFYNEGKFLIFFKIHLFNPKIAEEINSWHNKKYAIFVIDKVLSECHDCNNFCTVFEPAQKP